MLKNVVGLWRIDKSRTLAFILENKDRTDYDYMVTVRSTKESLFEVWGDNKAKGKRQVRMHCDNASSHNYRNHDRRVTTNGIKNLNKSVISQHPSPHKKEDKGW